MWSWRESNVLELTSSEEGSSPSTCDSSSSDSATRDTGVDADQCSSLDRHVSNILNMMDIDEECSANADIPDDTQTVDHEGSPRSHSSAGDIDDCIICCDALVDEDAAGSNVFRMSCCKLVFHRECMVKWYKRCKRKGRDCVCPHCRGKFEIELDYSSEEEGSDTESESSDGYDEEYDDWSEEDSEDWDELRIFYGSQGRPDHNDPRFTMNTAISTFTTT